MCNLYERLAAEEVPGLLEHYELLGLSWSEAMEREARRNAPLEVYPKYPAAVIARQFLAAMRWGMPGPVLTAGQRPTFLTNVRNTESAHWKPWLKTSRCIVPARAFAEPDRTTAKPVINRWFARADGRPFFFAGVWRDWHGDLGTVKQPDIGLHRLFAILTAEPNGVVGPIHDKAMPVLLMTAEDVRIWLNGTLEEALKLQKPQPDHVIVVRPDKKAA